MFLIFVMHMYVCVWCKCKYFNVYMYAQVLNWWILKPSFPTITLYIICALIEWLIPINVNVAFLIRKCILNHLHFAFIKVVRWLFIIIMLLYISHHPQPFESVTESFSQMEWPLLFLSTAITGWEMLIANNFILTSELATYIVSNGHLALSLSPDI